MPAGALPIPQQIPGAGGPGKKDRATCKGPGKRGNTADREDPASEKETVKKSKGKDARRQEDRFSKEETAQPSCSKQ